MSVTAAQLPRPGDTIAGKYVLDWLLGQGGMGAVFAARHLTLSKQVAIKIMLADTSSPEAVQRFENEGRAAANIDSEHVVRVEDVDQEMGYSYMVLELLDGKDLSQLLELEPTKRMPVHVVVGFIVQALKGVMQAHALGIVHRDLKPSNLFLAKRKDGTSVVKVLDFGISKATATNALGQAPSALTSTKAMLGSPLYMSPEQLRNAKGVDHRADIWAMGIILYELMTGALPFMGDNLGELFAAILETDPIPLSQRIPGGIPAGLDEIVLRCLARKPDGRFQSVQELAVALAPYERPMPGMAGGQKGGTAFIGAMTPVNFNLPPGSQNGSQQIPPIHATGGHAPHPGAITPPNQFMQTPPHMASQPGVLNAQNILPQGFNQTGNSGWQQGQPQIPKSKAPIFIGIAFGFIGLLGLAGILVYVKSHGEDAHAKVPPPAVSSAVPTADPPASVTVANTAQAPPPPQTSASAAESAAPSAAPAPTHVAAPSQPGPASHPQPPQGPTTKLVPAPGPAPAGTAPHMETAR